jgi:Spy/CpxP family protein refolding chaperone
MDESKPNKKRRKTMRGMKSIVAFWVLTYIFAGWLGVYALDSAPPVPGKTHGGHGRGFLKVLTQLNLTDSQKQDIANTLKQHREEIRDLRSKMFDTKKALLDAVTANEFSEEAVRGAARQTAGIEEQFAVLRAKLFDEIRKLLTLEQQETLTQLKADFASRMQAWRERRMSRMDQWIDENSGQ